MYINILNIIFTQSIKTFDINLYFNLYFNLYILFIFLINYLCNN